jgi:aspartyl protease family protein
MWNCKLIQTGVVGTIAAATIALAAAAHAGSDGLAPFDPDVARKMPFVTLTPMPDPIVKALDELGLGNLGALPVPHSVVVLLKGLREFKADGRVNGYSISFVIDTGATDVVLTARDASRLGIYPPPNAFTFRNNTANGTVYGARVRLDAVAIGNVEVRDIVAVVLPEQALGDSLLGMSFLSRLSRFEYSDGRLVLEQ